MLRSIFSVYSMIAHYLAICGPKRWPHILGLLYLGSYPTSRKAICSSMSQEMLNMRKIALFLSVLSLLCGCGGGGSSKKTPVISVSMAPSSQMAIDQGQTLNYTATVTNDSNAAGVSWSMSGTACTGAACGTFTGGTTSAVTYNAPVTVSAKTTVTIVAASVADTTKSVSSTVVVTPAPSITTTSLSGGTVGTAYSATLQGTGGVG